MFWWTHVFIYVFARVSSPQSVCVLMDGIMCISLNSSEEKETVGICTNVIVFLQEENETVGMCTNYVVFFFRRKKRL